MKTVLMLAVGAFALMTIVPANAHPVTYVQAAIVGDVVVDCEPSTPDVCAGGAIYPAGHVPAGPASVTITDLANSPVSGLLRHAGVDTPFCGSVGFAATGGSVIVFVDGVVFGNPVLSPCGTLSAGTAGTITHTP